MILKFLTFTSLLLPFCLLADPKSFDFKDAKGVNAIIFQLDALFGIDKWVRKWISNSFLRLEKPENTKGSIIGCFQSPG